MALLPPGWLNCVVAIGRRHDDGSTHFFATGFVYLWLRREGESTTAMTYLITNRHVFDDEELLVVRFDPEGNAPAKEFDLPLGGGATIWLAHDDEDVDVAAAPISWKVLNDHGIPTRGFTAEDSIGCAEARREGITEGDSVFFLGFPMGLVGRHQNYAIVRGGSIARVREMLSGGSKDFLIDAFVFPGSSGSPVITRPEFMAVGRSKAQPRARLIGIVSAYIPYEDEAVSVQTGLTRVVFQENSGLASVFPTDFIDDVVKELERRSGRAPAEGPVPPEVE